VIFASNIDSIFNRFGFSRVENVFSKFTLHFPAPKMQIVQKINEWQAKKELCRMGAPSKF